MDMTVDRFGIQTIKDALVTLLSTTNVSDLNSGLTKSVKQVISIKPDMGQSVIPVTMFPTVNVWSNRAEIGLRGASKRYEMKMVYQIDMWTRSMVSIHEAKNELEILSDNVLYILFNNIEIAIATNGYIKPVSFTPDYNTNESGFIAHGIIELEVYRALG
jgi:hypothetical protein